jgi:hypothetical protein
VVGRPGKGSMKGGMGDDGGVLADSSEPCGSDRRKSSLIRLLLLLEIAPSSPISTIILELVDTAVSPLPCPRFMRANEYFSKVFWRTYFRISRRDRVTICSGMPIPWQPMRSTLAPSATRRLFALSGPGVAR